MNQSTSPVIIISSPSGGGKTTFIRRLLADFPILKLSISATTRKPRNNEINQVDYHFLSEADFIDLIHKDAFLEWVKLYKHIYYGSLKKEIYNNISKGYVCLFDIDVEGAKRLKKVFHSNSLSMFILPPSMEVLEQRLINRKTENNAELKERLEYAKKEINSHDFYDYIVTNLHKEQTYKMLKQRIHSFLKHNSHTPICINH